MTILRVFLARLAGLFRRGKAEHELAEELRTHLEMAIEENLRRGMPLEEARRAAQIRFGGIQQAQEACRDQQRLPILETIFLDLRFGLRALLKSPGFTITALVTLALGISVNTVMFSVFNTVIFHALPFPHAHRLVSVWYGSPKENIGSSSLSFREVAAIEEHGDIFESLGYSFFGNSMILGTGDHSPPLNAAKVSSGFFETFGIAPMLGRWFFPEEHQPGKNRVVILSYSIWEKNFGCDHNLIGHSIQLDHQPYQIVGVMPPEFITSGVQGTYGSIWIPYPSARLFAEDPSSRDKNVVGRLRPGINLKRAQAEINAIGRSLVQKYPDIPRDICFRLTTLLEQTVGPLKRILLLFMGAVGLVLLIASANTANLQLARNEIRQRELAIRLAMGAGRPRIFQLFLIESLLIGLLGGGLGLAISIWGIRMIRVLGPSEIPRLSEISIDLSVLAFTFLVSILTAFLFGTIPAWQASKLDLNTALKSGARSSRAGFTFFRGNRFQSMLVLSQVALAVLLLVGSTLLLRSLSHLTSVSLGFDPKNLLAIQLDMSTRLSYKEASQYCRQVLGEINKLPRVISSAHSMILPLGLGGAVIQFGFATQTTEEEWKGQTPVQFQTASSGYFRTMGIPILKGRCFTERDRTGSPAVVIVSQSLAQSLWPGKDPIGKRIQLGNGGQPCIEPYCFEIVGVAGDVRDTRLDAQLQPGLYFSDLQFEFAGMHAFIVRTAPNRPPPVDLILDRIQSTKMFQKPMITGTVEQFMEKWLKEPRFRTLLLGIFAGLALVLSAVGIFGATAYSVGQRTQEIGIRMALGAQPGNIMRMVMRYCLLVIIVGIALGLGGAAALTRLLGSILFEVKPLDPATFLFVPLFFAIIAGLASLFATLRILKINLKDLLVSE